MAEDYELPLEAVHEAIDYCLKNPQVLHEDRDRESASIDEYEKFHPPVLPPVL